MSDIGSWLTLFGLGAYHGINPGMGWLFAVALGLQERSRRAVLAALPPIALGHALSISLVVGILWLAQASLPGNGFAGRRRAVSVCLRRLPVHSIPAPNLGGNAGRLPRPDRVVLHDGLGPWRRIDAGAGHLGWSQGNHHDSAMHSEHMSLMRQAGSVPPG